ncbi:TPA: hypothetical protein H1011_02205 [archaeon]|jgi:hypothetical protein|uniref:Uncharacterized protein n=1 Tax=Candidatus Undinarchaeum marinum TaxID=2756141 RepID=A0A832X585_9ARCH|nr:hypothetical protein [Candidatus Undinarchaeum marinum]
MSWLDDLMGTGDEGQYPSHRLAGALGILLLIIYASLGLSYAPFTALWARLLELLTAVKGNYVMMLSLAPLYLNWVSSDYFQERRGATLGNAASNGFTGLWVAFDWGRAAYVGYAVTKSAAYFSAKIFLAFTMAVYGGLVIFEAARGKRIARIIGRVREISFFAILLTPVAYGVYPFDKLTLLTLIVFYPLFYGLIEFINFFVLPVPKTEAPREEDEEE